MANTKPSSADYTNMSAKSYNTTAGYNDVSLYPNTYEVPTAPSTSETEYQMDWNQWNGYYLEVPELASIIDKKAFWTVGKGYKADASTKKLLDKIRGNGKQTFNTIMHNAVKVYTLGGDFYAEIVRTKRGKITNIKPLNPGTIKILANANGIITGYEQFAEVDGDAIMFKPNEIFHLPWNPQADSIHGTSTLLKLQKTIQMFQEAKQDLRVVFHRYVKPLLIMGVDTDDATEIAAFKAKVDSSWEKGENMIIPKDVLDKIEKISIPQFSTLDPIPWIKYLEAEFIKAEGVPEIILGAGEDTTEASSKILYLAFQQMVEWNQLFLEEQIKNQLGLEVEFEFPASIAPELINDEKKDAPLNQNKVTPGKDNK